MRRGWRWPGVRSCAPSDAGTRSCERYVMTLHGHEEMEAYGLTVYDVEHVILTGRIVERQRDRSRKEWKYLVEGETLQGDAAVVVEQDRTDQEAGGAYRVRA